MKKVYDRTSEKELRVAIPIKGKMGLNDSVSDVFGRATAFVVFDIEEKEIKNLKVLENPAISYEHGDGPIVVKMLIENGVNMIMTGEVGPGASGLLEHHNVKKVSIKAGIRVKEAIKQIGVKLTT